MHRSPSPSATTLKCRLQDTLSAFLLKIHLYFYSSTILNAANHGYIQRNNDQFIGKQNNILIIKYLYVVGSYTLQGSSRL